MTFSLITHPVKRLRGIAFVEGLTLLLLVLIAMPLKYVLNQPQYVSIMGPIHGVAFIAYIISLIEVSTSYGWNKTAFVKAFIAAIIPFGTFINDRNIEKNSSELASDH